MKEQLTKNILFHYFAGKASPLQKRWIEYWLENPANQELYFEWLEEWEQKHPQFIPNTNQALHQFLDQIHTSEEALIPVDRVILPKRKNYHPILYAACVSILLAVILALNWQHVQFKTYSTDFAEVSSFQLADGSKVALNANSKLRVPRFGFGESTREVYLEGEAEFSVVHTPGDNKFLVHTPDKLEVEVVGTEFIVYSRPRGSRVVLTKGKVLLRSLSDTTRRTLTIKPGDIVTIQKGAFRVKEKQATASHAAWKESRFVFNHTSFQEIAYQVEENFGLKVHIKDSLLAKRKLTGTYEAESGSELLTVLGELLDANVRSDGQEITVSAKK